MTEREILEGLLGLLRELLLSDMTTADDRRLDDLVVQARQLTGAAP